MKIGCETPVTSGNKITFFVTNNGVLAIPNFFKGSVYRMKHIHNMCKPPSLKLRGKNNKPYPKVWEDIQDYIYNTELPF